MSADPDDLGGEAGEVDRDRPADDAGQPAGGTAGRGRRGLFRRNRSAAPEAAPASGADAAGTTAEASATEAPATDPNPPGRSRGRGRAERPVPARDEDYVDWVSGLAGDATDDRPLAEPDAGPRRTLRSSGRHHVD